MINKQNERNIRSLCDVAVSIIRTTREGVEISFANPRFDDATNRNAFFGLEPFTHPPKMVNFSVKLEYREGNHSVSAEFSIRYQIAGQADRAAVGRYDLRFVYLSTDMDLFLTDWFIRIRGAE